MAVVLSVRHRRPVLSMLLDPLQRDPAVRCGVITRRTSQTDGKRTCLGGTNWAIWIETTWVGKLKRSLGSG